MRKFKEWTVKDRFPKDKLDDIEPVSLRAFSLVNRNKDRIDDKEGAPEFLGILNMMEALDYHFDNFIRHRESEKSSSRSNEIVAYLNRIGQIYYFIGSDFTRGFIKNPLDLTPTVNELKIFRMKNTAHRSVDFPKNESVEYRNRQALTFLGIQVNKFQEFERHTIPIEKDGKTEWNHFTPEIDHPKVMSELFNLIFLIMERIASNENG